MITVNWPLISVLNETGVILYTAHHHKRLLPLECGGVKYPEMFKIKIPMSQLNRYRKKTIKVDTQFTLI